jgi:hypothetical protein
MGKGGKITGQLTAKGTGKPLAGFCVRAVATSGPFGGTATTRNNGDYAIRGLNTGSYNIQVTNCAATAATQADIQLAQTVKVTAPQTVSGVNGAVPNGGSVSGTVQAGSPPATQAGVCVEAIPKATGNLQVATTTTHTGHYVLSNLHAGNYFIHFDTAAACDTSQDGLISQWYDGVATQDQATQVTVTAGQVTPGIGAKDLQPDGGISGTVTASSNPVTGVCVRAVPKAAGVAASVAVTAGGSYSITGLAPGSYTVEFSSGCGATGLATQWWNGKATAADATPVTVQAGAVATGIDAAMTS